MKDNKSSNKIRYLEDCLLINNEILVFSDFHIGYEEHSYGKYIPIRTQLEEILKKIHRIFGKLDKEEIKIKEIVILGDLKHEFGEISDSEWRETLELLDYFLKKTSKIVLIRGNHDNIIGPIAKKKNIEIKEYYINEEIGFLHGNKWFEECKDCRKLILGHLHPSIVISDNYKREKYKCFLRGKWKRREIIIIPSFIPLIFGYDVWNILEKKNDREEFFIIENKILEKFEVVVYDEKEDKNYNFGKLRRLKKLI